MMNSGSEKMKVTKLRIEELIQPEAFSNSGVSSLASSPSVVKTSQIFESNSITEEKAQTRSFSDFLAQAKELLWDEQVKLMQRASWVADKAGEGSLTWNRMSDLFDRVGKSERYFESLAQMLILLGE